MKIERAPNQDQCLIIAEIGTGHAGDLARARDLIGAAAEAGADCAKFQLVIADELVHPKTGRVTLPGGTVDLYSRFKALERPQTFYEELKSSTESLGLRFLCTAFGVGSARVLGAMGCSAIKIASPELNHYPLLETVAELGIPAILSTGVSKLEDIERALEVVSDIEALLHCVTWYPAPEEEYNLRLVPTLRTLFGVPVGVSDHSLDPILVPAVAASLGSAVVEKHLTLSRAGSELDDSIALEPADFAKMVRAVRATESSPDGQGDLRHEFGEARIEAILGSGIKRLAPSERENYHTTNRSILAWEDLSPGTAITHKNVALLRSEKNLEPGLSPRFLGTLIGRRVIRPVAAGSGLRWDDVIPD